MPQDQIFRLQLCSRPEERSQDAKNQLEQISHQAEITPSVPCVYVESNFRYTQSNTQCGFARVLERLAALDQDAKSRRLRDACDERNRCRQDQRTRGRRDQHGKTSNGVTRQQPGPARDGEAYWKEQSSA